MTVAGASSATVITFDSLTGGNGDGFFGTAEAGFYVVALTRRLREARVFGNPVPAIRNDTAGGSISVTAAGGGLSVSAASILAAALAPEILVPG